MTDLLPERDTRTTSTTTWVGVCHVEDLTPGRGVCAIVGGRQVAVVLTASGAVFALSNHDPFSDAYVLSRGVVGSRQVGDVEVPTLQSPLYKQAFDLRTGRCLDDQGVMVRPYRARVRAGVVEIESGE